MRIHNIKEITLPTSFPTTEDWAALAFFGCLGAYALILYLLKKRHNSRFFITIPSRVFEAGETLEGQLHIKAWRHMQCDKITFNFSCIMHLHITHFFMIGRIYSLASGALNRSFLTRIEVHSQTVQLQPNCILEKGQHQSFNFIFTIPQQVDNPDPMASDLSRSAFKDMVGSTPNTLLRSRHIQWKLIARATTDHGNFSTHIFPAVNVKPDQTVFL